MYIFEQEIMERRESRWADFTAKAAGLGLDADYSGADWQSLKTAFGVSNFVFMTFLRNPRLPFGIMAEDRLHGALAPDYYAAALHALTRDTAAEDVLSRKLRHFRYKEMGRLAWRDLAGFASLESMTAELSQLARACIDTAIGWLYPRLAERFGTPMGPGGEPVGPVVLGLGKLGAGELNFSSDIDLIFAYAHNGLTTDGRKETTNKDFFVRLSRQLIKVLGDVTVDGFVFRVDARLRPFGDTGELSLAFDEMEAYYEHHGREWERYAWIKAMPVGGDMAAGHELVRRLTPFVYRRYLDYNAFDSLREMKHMINQDVARQGMEDNVKLGRGGIREIEFFGQVFQLIRGGVEPYLRAPQIVKVLNILADNGNIPAKVKNELLEAYTFLRRTEHHIQEMDDRQTHDLPTDMVNKLALAQSLGFETLFEFDNVLYNYRKIVNHHFQLLLEDLDEDARTDETLLTLQMLWKRPRHIAGAASFLTSLGFADGEAALKSLDDFAGHANVRNLSNRALTRLDKLMPKIITAAAQSPKPEMALGYLIDILLSIAHRLNYMSLLVENPAALDNLIRLCLASPWIARFLSMHPVLLDELVDTQHLRLTDKPGPDLYQKLKSLMDSHPDDDEEGRIEIMCVFKQTNMLRVVTADVLGNMSLMNVSDWLSAIAEACVRAAVNMAWKYLTARHGAPLAKLNGKDCGRGFAVAAYGKLGGLELGYDSDLDLVFLHAAAEGYTNGARPVDNNQFYNRLAQRVVHILTAPTRAGRVYEIDTRLRPSGASGLLVTHINAFREYQLGHAWLWEHQALIKARPVFGENVMLAYFEDVRREVLSQPAKPQLEYDVVDMRAKINQALYHPQKGLFDLKYSPGGMVDIEFLVQYLVLRYAQTTPGLLQWTDVVRQIQELNRARILSAEMAHILKRAYLLYRATGHRLSLEAKPKEVADARFDVLQRGIVSIWRGFFGKISTT